MKQMKNGMNAKMERMEENKWQDNLSLQII